jgi:hypothetical protein
MGFVTSTLLAPLVIVLGTRICRPDLFKPNLHCDLSFIALCSLMALWAPSGIVLLPLVVLFLWSRRLPTARQLAIGGALAAFIIPPLFVLWNVSNVGSFLQTGSVAAEQRGVSELVQNDAGGTESQASASTSYRHRAKFSLSGALAKYHEGAAGMNPLLLMLAIPSIVALPRGYRATYALLSLLLLGCSTVGVALKPQLELDRMFVLLGLLLSVPVAALIDRSILTVGRRWLDTLSSAFVVGLLTAGMFATSFIASNRSLEQFHFADQAVFEMIDLARKETEKGRGVFTGCVLHQLSEGHLGPIAALADAPLVASSYAHNIWQYQQVVPASFMKRGPVGIEEYLDLMNATLVFAHEPFWREYFSQRPERYESIWRGGRFSAYRRSASAPSYFLQGSGEIIRQAWDGVVLRLTSPSAVLKFSYFPFLRAGKCSIAPEKVAPELTFIRLENCPVGEPIVIDSVPLMARLGLAA